MQVTLNSGALCYWCIRRGVRTMMEKYGVEDKKTTYEVVLPKPGTPDDYQIIGSQLSLVEATDLQDGNKNAIIRPER